MQNNIVQLVEVVCLPRHVSHYPIILDLNIIILGLVELNSNHYRNNVKKYITLGRIVKA